MQKFSSTKLFKVIVIAALFVLLIFINPYSIFNPIRSIFLIAAEPFQKVFYSFSLGVENTKDFLSSVGELKNENQNLIKENQRLLAENSMLQDVQKESDMLREQLSLIPRNQYDLIAATVVSQDPNGTGNWLEIDKGSDDGILEGMAVIVSRGILIGRVQGITPKSSQIILLTNPKSTINVTTVENGAKGIIKGEYGLGIILDMVLQTDSIQSGDNIITSGMGGNMPRGLYVGTVQEVHPSEDHLFQQAVVTAPIQISKIEMVFVIKGSK